MQYAEAAGPTGMERWSPWVGGAWSRSSSKVLPEGSSLLGKSLRESLPSPLRGSEGIISKGLRAEAGAVSTRASCHYSYFLLSAMMLM